jgi:hypothetical protein
MRARDTPKCRVVCIGRSRRILSANRALHDPVKKMDRRVPSRQATPAVLVDGVQSMTTALKFEVDQEDDVDGAQKIIATSVPEGTR